ncbi:hypothetical protein ISG10_36890, partial [Burkholderia pseudomallei]|nr:hypothetical protein [Burkholderia pseudomallei]
RRPDPPFLSPAFRATHASRGTSNEQPAFGPAVFLREPVARVSKAFARASARFMAIMMQAQAKKEKETRSEDEG